MDAPAVNYPQIRDEWETMRKVCGGFSLARFGDGELKLVHGKGYKREPGSQRLAAELLQVLTHPHPRCLVGVPTMSPAGPKYQNWLRHAARFADVLEPARVTYYSAFVTRPDSAPWINCAEFAQLARTLWQEKRVTVISEARNKLLTLARLSAQQVKHVRCPSYEAYARADELEDRAVTSSADVVLLSCGPTATCLANRLARRGIHAVDMGSAGGYLLALLLK